jgi:hypothetical protein
MSRPSIRFGLLHPVCVANLTTTTLDDDSCHGTSIRYQAFLTGGWSSTAKGGTYLAQLTPSPEDQRVTRICYSDVVISRRIVAIAALALVGVVATSSAASAGLGCSRAYFDPNCTTSNSRSKAAVVGGLYPSTQTPGRTSGKIGGKSFDLYNNGRGSTSGSFGSSDVDIYNDGRGTVSGRVGSKWFTCYTDPWGNTLCN